MPTITPNLRKAALLIRSLDALTAADLLGQLAPEEAAAVRRAVQSLGPIDPEEEAGLANELRRAVLTARANAEAGVELSLSAKTFSDEANTSAYQVGIPSTGVQTSSTSGTRFEFLERAPIASLVPYLSREHVQTIAVVLSYLSPSRAAAVLAALPPQRQADTLERLSVLGETDPDSLMVVEQELAAWVTAQSARRREGSSGGVVSAILAAADAATREGILANLKTHKQHLAVQFDDASSQPTWKQIPLRSPRSTFQAEKESETRTSFKTWEGEAPAEPNAGTYRLSRSFALPNVGFESGSRQEPPAAAVEEPRVPFDAGRVEEMPRNATANLPHDAASSRPRRAARVHFEFDDLLQLDSRTLAAVLHDVDASVLVLALAGSSDALVERIAGEMPKRTAKAFRRRLRQLGPTRLSDVSAAQRVVARAAAERLGPGNNE